MLQCTCCSRITTIANLNLTASWCCSSVQSSDSVPLIFWWRRNNHFFVLKVPEGRHVKGHVGKDHQVLKECKECVDCGI